MPPIFKIQNLKYKISGNTILDIPQLEIKDKDFISVIGKSGAGKSTFLKLLFFFHSKYQGELFYNNQDIKRTSIAVLRSEVKMMPQIIPFPSSNLEVALKQAFQFKYNQGHQWSEEEALKLLQQFQLSHLSLNQSIKNLSGGEKQRLYLIMLLLLKPKVILLDEPTSALDEQNTAQVIRVLKEINTTVITITHSHIWKKASSRIIQLDNGIILSDTGATS